MASTPLVDCIEHQVNNLQEVTHINSKLFYTCVYCLICESTSDIGLVVRTCNKYVRKTRFILHIGFMKSSMFLTIILYWFPSFWSCSISCCYYPRNGNCVHREETTSILCCVHRHIITYYMPLAVSLYISL